MFIEKIDFEKFMKLWNNLYKEFECITTEDPKSAFEDYLKDNLAIRFSYKNKLYSKCRNKVWQIRYRYLELE